MQKVFPTTELPLSRMKRRGQVNLFDDGAALGELEGAGLDMDPHVWTFEYRVRGGATGNLPISSKEKRHRARERERDR